MAGILDWWYDLPPTFYTTTLYPVVIVEPLQLGIALDSGSMSAIPEASFQSTMSVQNGTYTQLRWFYTDGPYDGYFQSSMDVLNGTYTQIRWFFTDGPYDGYFQSTMTVGNGTYISHLVEILTGHADNEPWEELQLNIAVNDTCTMDPV